MTWLAPDLAAALLLVVAGVAKLVRPHDTARALAALAASRGRGQRAASPATSSGRLGSLGSLGSLASLGAAVALVRVGALLEAALGALAIAVPGAVTDSMTAVSYGLFTAFVLVARRRGGALATCGCFGKPDTPPTLAHVVLTAGFTLAAIAGALSSPGAASLTSVLSREPASGVPLVALTLAISWFAWMVMTGLARLSAPATARPERGGGS